MPETCSDSVNNKHLIVASCWFSLSLHNLLTTHGHRDLKLPCPLLKTMSKIFFFIKKCNVYIPYTFYKVNSLDTCHIIHSSMLATISIFLAINGGPML